MIPARIDPVAMIINAAGLNARSRAGLPSFTMESSCHSLWIVSRNKLRARYELIVIDQSDKERPHSFSAIW